MHKITEGEFSWSGKCVEFIWDETSGLGRGLAPLLVFESGPGAGASPPSRPWASQTWALTFWNVPSWSSLHQCA